MESSFFETEDGHGRIELQVASACPGRGQLSVPGSLPPCKI